MVELFEGVLGDWRSWQGFRVEQYSFDDIALMMFVPSF
jgi:hypothetical protein